MVVFSYWEFVLPYLINGRNEFPSDITNFMELGKMVDVSVYK